MQWCQDVVEVSFRLRVLDKNPDIGFLEGLEYLECSEAPYVEAGA